MTLLDQAQRRIYREGLSDHLEANRRERKEEEFARAFAELDAQQALVGSGMEQLSYLKIQEMRAELTKMYDESLGAREQKDVHGKDIEGGPGTIIFKDGG